MNETVTLKLDESSIRALKSDELKRLRERVERLENELHWLHRYVHEVLLAPDERQQAIRAGYGE